MLTATRYYLRRMTLADIQQVTAIERESFPTTWPPTAYRRELTNRLARYFVAVDRSRAAPSQARTRRSLVDVILGRSDPVPTSEWLAGYLGLWLMVDEAHIVAVAVRESQRRQGLGRALIEAAIDATLEAGLDSLTLEVRRSNTAAQALYEKYRFHKVGVRPRYYSDNREDAIIMSTPPITAPSYQEHLAWLKQETAALIPG
jgi:ribosomal-protein-alanine N-acetyltransferase